MSLFLNSSNLAVALTLIEHPDAPRLCAAMQGVCDEMGAALAASLGVTAGPAVKEIDGDSPGITLAPAEIGQECPNLLWAFGHLADWGN